MCVTRWLPMILLAFVMCGCGPNETAQDASEPAGTTPPASVPSSYHFMKSDSLNSEALEEAREALPYDEIQLERTQCYGACPSYVVTFRRDGTATYVGRAHVENIGKYSSSISVFDYGKLCWAIEKFKLTELEPNWFDSNMPDNPTTVLRMNDSRTGLRAEVGVSGLPGPVELWLVQNSIDKLTNELQWRAAEDSVIRKSDSATLIDDVAQITLVTPNSSALTERIRVDVPNATMRARFMKAINNLTIEGDGIAMNQAADMRALDVKLLIQDHSGYDHSVGLYWGPSDNGAIVYESSVYRVSAGLTDLRKLIADNSTLPEFGGLRPDGQITK